MKVDTFKCDACGNLKAVANHWWLAVIESASIEIITWDDDRARCGPEYRHLCGRECVQKVIERFMEGYTESAEG